MLGIIKVRFLLASLSKLFTHNKGDLMKRRNKKKAWKATRNRVWKVKCTRPTFVEAVAKRDEMLKEDSDSSHLREHTLGPNDEPVKIKARPDGTFDVKILIVDSEIKKEKEEAKEE
jgi:hypothetical protein